MSNEIRVHTNPPIPKLLCLYDEEYVSRYEYFLLHGGRGGAKTEEVGRWLICNSFKDPANILCTREIQNSIEESVMAVLWDWVEVMELDQYFHKTKTYIINKLTGARFIFRGMNAGTKKDSLKGIKGVKYVWVEEAQTLSADSWEKLNPSVRINGRKLFFTYNPETEDDTVNSIKDYGDKVCDIEINYMDNQYLPQVLLDQALLMEKLYPELFKHIWLGQYKTSSEANTVLPYELLRRCIDAHKKVGKSGGHTYAGLDLAPGMDERKHDKNAECFVHGPIVRHAEHWQCDDLDPIANKVIRDCGRWGALRVYFDAVGVGGFANGTLKRKLKESKTVLRCEPFMGSNAVFGPDTIFMRASTAKKGVITNKDFFKNAKAQMWWNIRLRMENTIALLEGKEVRDPTYFLSFDSRNPNLERLLIELSQATYKEDSSGRIMIDKAPGDKEIKIDGKTKKVRSPNLADGCGQAFLRSCRNGLRAN